jgi:hypothetical protein
MPTYPISYAIPDYKILKEAPNKVHFMAHYQPGMKYCFKDEKEYLECYKNAVFGLTYKKAGWDCWRHVEIMSQGCFPYMLDIDTIPKYTMAKYPKEKIKRWMNEYGQSNILTIRKYSSSKLTFDIEDCLEETRNSLSATSQARDVLQKCGNPRSIFYITRPVMSYIESSLLYGLKNIESIRVAESILSEPFYSDYPIEKLDTLYGKGMNYTRLMDKSTANVLSKDSIVESIKNREFDLIVYPYVQESIEYIDIVTRYYDQHEIALVCESDCDPLNDPDIGWVSTKYHNCIFQRYFSNRAHFFLREGGEELPGAPYLSNQDFGNGIAHIYNEFSRFYNRALWKPTFST